MGMAYEGGACVWRELVCVSYRCGSECLSDTPQTTKKKILIHRKIERCGRERKEWKGERLKN